MKKLLYSGLMALMMLFAFGSAKAQDDTPQDKVKVTLSSTTWTVGSEDEDPTLTVAITPAEGAESPSVTLGTEAGNFAVEVTFQYDEESSFGLPGAGSDVDDIKLVLTQTTTTLDVSKFTAAGYYDIKYRLVKGDEQTVVFDGAATTVGAGSTSIFTVENPNAVAAQYNLQVVHGVTKEDLSTETSNPVVLYYPSINIMAFDLNRMPMNGEFYYSFVTRGENAVEPTREAYEAEDNNGKVKKALTMNTYGMTAFVIYTDVPNVTTVAIKGYLTPMDYGDMDFAEGDDESGDNTEIITETYTYDLSFADKPAEDPVFAPAAPAQIASGDTVRISNFDTIYGDYEMGSVYYSLNGKTPLFGYGYTNEGATAGIVEYDDEEGIIISGNVGDQVTITAIAYALDEEFQMLAASTIVTATYTIKAADPEPAGDLFVLSPATGSTVNVGDEITITSATVDDDEISYKWFATRTEAEAAEFSYATWSNYDDAGKPVVAAGLPVLAVTKGFMTETAGSRMYAEYTINAAAPGVEITFMPADGAEVEVGDTIKLAANDDVTIVYMMFPSKDIAQVSDWKWNEEGVEGEQVGFVYGSDYPVITETMKALKVGYITAENLDSEEPENVWFYAEYTIKGGETPGKLDVDIEFMTDAYGQARFAKKSDKIRLVLEDYEGIELYYAIVTDEEEQPSYVQYGEGLIGLSELEGNFTVKAYAVKGIQRSDVFSAEYVLLDIIEPTLEFDATAAKNYPMEFNVKSVSYPDIMDKDMMVYYTLDGETEPSDTAFLNQEGDVIKYLQKQEGIWQNYLEPTENITVWAKAYVLLDEGANLVMETPAVKKAVEMSELSNPVITPAVAATEYNAGDTVKVAIEVPEDADVLYYTLDGSEPLFSRTIGNEDLIDSVIFAYYPSWGEPFDTIVVTKSTTVKAIAYKEPAFRMGYVPGAGSDVVSATFGFKVELTFDPESGSEVYEGTRVAITSEDETIDIFYMMFESEEAAKAAEWNQEEAELYGEMQPVVTKSSNTVKVAYARRGATEVTENFFYATYTVKELPAVTLTLNPATGSEVEENTKVTVTPSRELVEGEAIVFRMFANKTAADTCADDVMINEGMIYGEPDEDDDQIGYPVITQEAPVLKIGVLGAMDEEGNWIYNWIVAEYKIKGQVSANEAGELAGVSIYPNPTEGEFNVVAPVNAEVEIFNATGVVVKRVNVSAGANAMRLENSGIYFVRVRANGQVAIKKVVIR